MDYSRNFRSILVKSKKSSITYLTTNNLLTGLIATNQSTGYKILSEMLDINKLIKSVGDLYMKAIDNYDINESDSNISMRMTADADNTMMQTSLEAKKLRSQIIKSEHLLLALVSNKIIDLPYDDVLEKVKSISNEYEHDDEEELDDINYNKNKNMAENGKLLIEKFSTDLTKSAREGLLDPVVGREEELKRVAQVLSRRKKNNPVLVGNPGVGKTSVVDGLAINIVNGNCPDVLEGKRILALDMASIVAGTKYRGEFEERMKKIVDELKANPDIIVFIDEMHTIMGAGGSSGSLDAANILKPALSRGEINCIGSTTDDEYRKIEKDGALDRRFQKVKVKEPTLDETRLILHNLKERYEDYHMVKYTNEAIESCLNLSDRYITSRFFPDKAIDAMDEAGSSVRINFGVPDELSNLETEFRETHKRKLDNVANQLFEDAAKEKKAEDHIREKITKLKNDLKENRKLNKKTVTSEDVAKAVSVMTGIPSKNINENDVEKLINLSTELKKLVIGQDEAIDKISKAILRNSAGLGDMKRPIGTFLFTGSTGIGKTHLAKKLAEKLFNSERDMVRIDMSEYMEKHSVSRMVGSPPGYVGHEEGGQLTEAVRRNPYSIILLDEIEKAHKDVWNILLQVFEDGILTDSHGKTVNFKNTVIIMTSNVGSKEAKQAGSGIGFNTDSKTTTRNIIEKEIKNKFAPEFLNRIDEIIFFNKLSKDSIKTIINIELSKFINNVGKNGIDINIDDSALEFLFKKGWDEEMGARPLKRAIQKFIEDEISVYIITKKFKTGDTINISHVENNEELSFDVVQSISETTIDTAISN